MAKRGNIADILLRDEVERPLRIHKYKQFILIVCEDEKTEPVYFKQFQNNFPKETMIIIPIGTGRDPLGVVKRAIIERNRYKTDYNIDIDFIWTVFDKDDADENVKKIKNFDNAFTLAKKENIQIAYSNEVFELWLLLHLTNVANNKPLPRNVIYNLLQKQINKSSEKYKNFVYDHYKPNNIVKIIQEIGNESQAIKKAHALFEFHKDKKPIVANPSTKVHFLVIELRTWIKYYSS